MNEPTPKILLYLLLGKNKNSDVLYFKMKMMHLVNVAEKTESHFDFAL